MAVPLIFLALAVMPILVVRLRQRRVKIAGLVLATFSSFIVASVNIPGSSGMPLRLPFSVIAIAFLLLSAVLESRVGRAAARYQTVLNEL